MDVKRGLEILEQESETRILSKVEKKDLQNERLGAKVAMKCRGREKKKFRVNKGTNKWGFRACTERSCEITQYKKYLVRQENHRDVTV